VEEERNILHKTKQWKTNCIKNPLGLGLPSSHFPSTCSGRFVYRAETCCCHFTTLFVTRISIMLLSTWNRHVHS